MQKINSNPQTGRRIAARRIAATLAAALILGCASVMSPAAAAPATAPTQQLVPVVYMPVLMSNFPVETIFGVEMQSITAGGGLAPITDAKMNWTRKNALLWSDVEPTEGARNWAALASLEQEMKNASASGLKLILIVRDAPTWAQLISGVSCGPVRADKVAAFGNFMFDVVKRYSGSPYNVKHWEIWNEPDVGYQIRTSNSEIFGCYGDTDPSVPYYGGGRYAQLLQAAYPRIKQADPLSQVLVGGLLLDCRPISPTLGCAARSEPSATRSSQFLEGILKGGGGPFFDGVAYHAYDGYRSAVGRYGQGGYNSSWDTTGPSVHAKTQFIKQVLAAHGFAGKDLYNTETGVGCGEGCGVDSLNTQAYYMMEVFAAALAEGVKAQILYSAQSTWVDTNLLVGVTPRASMVALKIAREKFQNATFTQYITQFPGVRIYELSRPGKRFWVAKSIDGTPRTITLPAVPLRITDPMGANVPAAATVTIDVKPLYIEWN